MGMSKRSTTVRKYPVRIASAVCLAALLGSVAPPAARADHGFPHVEVLGHGAFVEDVSATFKVKDLEGGTQVLKMKDASDMWVLHVSLEAGGIAPWHTHSGSGMLINMGPGTVTNVVGDDCVPHYYLPNEAFVDSGDGELHAVRNDSDDEVSLLIVFFGIEEAPVTPVGEGPHGCDFLD
jgi:hypothetical protein